MHAIGGLVLAAGGSTRMGRPKQLIALHGETLVHGAVRAAQEGGCDLVCVVTGHARGEVEAAVADLGPLLAHNEKWRRGMGTSLRLGLATLPSVAAVVVLSCDQPAVNGGIVRSLIDQHRRSGRAIVASEYAGTLGIPALFEASCFPEFNGLPDHRGAKSVIHADLRRVATVRFEGGGFDLDTPEELAAWIEKTRPSPDDAVRGQIQSCGTSGHPDAADQREPNAAASRS